MKFLTTVKDGGPESHVWAHVLFEIKGLASVILLRFEDGSREAYHNHAFNCFSWVLSGKLTEYLRQPNRRLEIRWHVPSWLPFITRRKDFHQVRSTGRTWVLTFRGPWSRTWREYLPTADEYVTLTHGRRVVGTKERTPS